MEHGNTSKLNEELLELRKRRTNDTKMRKGPHTYVHTDIHMYMVNKKTKAGLTLYDKKMQTKNCNEQSHHTYQDK